MMWLTLGLVFGSIFLVVVAVFVAAGYLSVATEDPGSLDDRQDDW